MPQTPSHPRLNAQPDDQSGLDQLSVLASDADAMSCHARPRATDTHGSPALIQSPARTTSAISPSRAVARDSIVSPRAQYVSRVRVCVLCGDVLRPGQRIIRVQGSSIHARCSTLGR